jgi:hypothetical protein
MATVLLVGFQNSAAGPDLGFMLWVPKTCATWGGTVDSVPRSGRSGPSGGAMIFGLWD